MPAKEIKELRQAGKLEEALNLAKAELLAKPENKLIELFQWTILFQIVIIHPANVAFRPNILRLGQ